MLVFIDWKCIGLFSFLFFVLDFIRSEVKELQTNCEIVWAELNITRTKQILVGSYY
jgi:hypothetical protein